MILVRWKKFYARLGMYLGSYEKEHSVSGGINPDNKQSVQQMY